MAAGSFLVCSTPLTHPADEEAHSQHVLCTARALPQKAILQSRYDAVAVQLQQNHNAEQNLHNEGNAKCRPQGGTLVHNFLWTAFNRPHVARTPHLQAKPIWIFRDGQLRQLPCQACMPLVGVVAGCSVFVLCMIFPTGKDSRHQLQMQRHSGHSMQLVLNHSIADLEIKKCGGALASDLFT